MTHCVKRPRWSLRTALPPRVDSRIRADVRRECRWWREPWAPLTGRPNRPPLPLVTGRPPTLMQSEVRVPGCRGAFVMRWRGRWAS